MVVGFVFEDGSMNNIDIGDYVLFNVFDIIFCVNGVGEV